MTEPFEAPILLVVVGDLIEDVVIKLEAPLVVGHDNVGGVYRTQGGSGANVAKAAAAHAPTRFVGRVGNDPLGRSLFLELQGHGIDVRLQFEGRTGCVAVLVDETGERTMIPDRGAGAELGAIDPAWLAQATWLHVTLYGVAFSQSRAAIATAAGLAKSSGASVSLDMSSAPLILDLLASGDLIHTIALIDPDVIFANADEADLLDLPGHFPSSTVIRKASSEPVTVFHRGTRTDVPVLPVHDVKDTTGAGDAFAAGYVTANMKGFDVIACVTAGNAAAARAISRIGA